MRSTVITSLAALGLVGLSSTARADRDPTPAELTQIEAALKSAGFTQWEDIDWDDDGHWEIDDAVAADGKKVDLKLDEKFAVIERDPN